MKEVLFKITGFRPGYAGECRRGVKFIVEDDIKPSEFLKKFDEALGALFKHEHEWCNKIDET